MLIKPIRVTMDSIVGSFIYHEVIPMAIIKNENSLICPMDIHVRKLFFLVCQRNQSTTIVIMGLMINTKAIKITNGMNIVIFVVQKLTWDQSKTKKITMKKSLKGFILLVISNLYAELAKVIHAINVHISIPNPNR